MTELTSKQRAYLKGLAHDLDTMFQIGKAGVTPEAVQSVSELFNTHELIKGSVLKTCTEDLRAITDTLAGRTRSTGVQVIGRKIVLYKPFDEDPEIILPKK